MTCMALCCLTMSTVMAIIWRWHMWMTVERALALRPLDRMPVRSRRKSHRAAYLLVGVTVVTQLCVCYGGGACGLHALYSPTAMFIACVCATLPTLIGAMFVMSVLIDRRVERRMCRILVAMQLGLPAWAVGALLIPDLDYFPGVCLASALVVCMCSGMAAQQIVVKTALADGA